MDLEIPSYVLINLPRSNVEILISLVKSVVPIVSCNDTHVCGNRAGLEKTGENILRTVYFAESTNSCTTVKEEAKESGDECQRQKDIRFQSEVLWQWWHKETTERATKLHTWEIKETSTKGRVKCTIFFLFFFSPPAILILTIKGRSTYAVFRLTNVTNNKKTKGIVSC